VDSYRQLEKEEFKGKKETENQTTKKKGIELKS